MHPCHDWSDEPFASWDKEPCLCHSGSVCGEACRRGAHHDGCQPKPVQLGHEFVGCTSAQCGLGCHLHGCGQPREAHE